MKKTILSFTFALIFLLTACNSDVKDNVSQEASIPMSSDVMSSEPPSSTIASSLPPLSNDRQYKMITKSEIVDDVNNIEKISIRSGTPVERKERDLTKDEMNQFKELLKAMEMTANVTSLPPSGKGSRGVIEMLMVDGSKIGFTSSVNFILGIEINGEMYVTKGGDEMINFVLGLDIYAESKAKSKIIDEYIDHQERNKIPTTLERMTE